VLSARRNHDETTTKPSWEPAGGDAGKTRFAGQIVLKAETAAKKKV